MIRLRMWREWTDDHGAYYASESFEAWQSDMRPHRFDLLDLWARDLAGLLARYPDRIPFGRLHELYDQAGTLRTLDCGTPWEVPFNRMRGAVQQDDRAVLEALAAELAQRKR